jgi:hypothetical protein
MDAKNRDYRCKGLETAKFDHRRESYDERLPQIISAAGGPENLLHHFPAYCGHVTLARSLFLYEMYKKTNGLSGHIAEAGVYKGTSVLQFAKMMQLFEPESLSLVFGFDWFRGNHPEGTERELVKEGSYFASFDDVERLVRLQQLEAIVRLVDINLATDALKLFFAANEHLHFKIVMLDCGLYKVVKNCIAEFWPRMSKGSVLILDNFNHETAPGESLAVRQLLPDVAINTLPFCAQPSAYIVK